MAHRSWSIQDAKNRPDMMIAATAIEHGLTVATRNVLDFEPTGAAIFNPFDPRPELP